MTVSCVYDFNADLPLGADLPFVIEGDIILGEMSPFNISVVNSVAAGVKKDYKASFFVEDETGKIYPSTTDGFSDRATIDMSTALQDVKYRLRIDIKHEDKSISHYASSWLSPEPEVSVSYRDSSIYRIVPGTAGTKELVSKRYYLDISSPGSSGCYCWEYELLIKIPATLSEPTYDFDPISGILVHRGYGWWGKSVCWSVSQPAISTVFSAKAMINQELKDHYGFSIQGYDYLRASKIKLKVRAIPEGAFRFLSTINKNSDNTGSVFSPVPGEAMGNIYNIDNPSELAVGYVSVYKQKETLILDADIPNNFHPVDGYVKNPLEGMTEGESELQRFQMFYEKGYRPYDSPTRWVPERCINCEMLMRGSSVYPDGW